MAHSRSYSATVKTTQVILDVPAHNVVHPAVVKYSQDFESYPYNTLSPDGWTPDGTQATGFTVWPGYYTTPNNRGRILGGTGSSSPAAVISRTITGLTVGKRTTVSATHYSGSLAGANPAQYAWAGVVGLGIGNKILSSTTSTNYPPALGVAYSFVPTATTHTVQLSVGGANNSGGLGYWDDIVVSEDAWTERVPDHYAPATTSYDLAVSDGSVTLDETTLPYGRVEMNVSVDTGADFGAIAATIDPRLNSRILFSVDDLDLTTGAHTVRTFDLQLDNRRVNPSDGSIDLVCVTDDATLINYRRIATGADTSFRALATSVRSIVASVMAKSGISQPLAAGTTDADFTPLFSTTNLVPNPSFEVDLTNASTFGTTGTGSTFTRAAGSFITQGTYGARLQFGTGALNSCGIRIYVPGLSGGQAYSFGGYARQSTAQNMDMRIVWVDDNKNEIAGSTRAYSGTVNVPAAGMTRITRENAIAPPAATGALIDFYGPNGSTPVNGNAMVVDAIMCVPGPYLTDYFDGSTAASAAYAYSWNNTPHNSASTRVAAVERSPDALLWQPGDSSWDFLAPILSQAGLRLFCDELRVWRLVPSDYTPPGLLSIIVGSNLFDGTDEIGRSLQAVDGTPLFFDACLVEYTWTDSAGRTQTRLDAYSLPGGTGTLAKIEYARPYPGPGAAAYWVTKSAQRGRQIETIADVDWTAKPSQEASLTFPYIDQQIGFVASLSWALGADEMTVTTRGLVTTPQTAWRNQPAGKSWASIAAGVSWATFS